MPRHDAGATSKEVYAEPWTSPYAHSADVCSVDSPVLPMHFPCMHVCDVGSGRWVWGRLDEVKGFIEAGERRIHMPLAGHWVRDHRHECRDRDRCPCWCRWWSVWWWSGRYL